MNRAIAVRQMGTAYCIEPKAGKIVWKVSPEGDKPMGLNTSSLRVAKGRVYYGTTAGNFHVLNARDGKVLWKTNEFFGVGGPPALFGGDKLFLPGGVAISTKDGSLVWKGIGDTRVSIGPDYAAIRGYGGAAAKVRLAEGKGYPGLQKGGQLGHDPESLARLRAVA